MKDYPLIDYPSWLAQFRRWVALRHQPAQGECTEHPNQAHGDGKDGACGGEEDGQSPEGGEGADAEAEEVAGEIKPLAPAQGAEVVPGEDGLRDGGSEAPADGVCDALPGCEDERAAGAVSGEEHREIHAGKVTEESGMSNGKQPWTGKLHHSRELCDDWGYIRDEAGKLIITVPVTLPHEQWNEHRRNNTDPTQAIVDAILDALNE